MATFSIEGAVAVVTGGASGIGEGIVRALLEREAIVVIADIEEPSLDSTVEEFAREFPSGVIEGVHTDVSDEKSVELLAEWVFSSYGRCNLLFNNAGVGSGGGGRIWANEPNDWKWCFGVNVFGVAHGIISFVPRMIASDQPGHVINTSSGDGGFAPVPMASVYASSKSAVSCLTEALQNQLLEESERVRASVFYPSGGLMDTGLYNSQRNRPDHLKRVRGGTGRASMSFNDLKALIQKSGRQVTVADINDLGRFVLSCVEERRYVIARELESTIDLLHRRAEAIARFELPPHHELGL